MKGNKYYTPEIDEFFDKLEFEYKEYLEESDEYSDKWISVRFDARSGLGHDMTHQLYEETIRVKYLDKEDLVELGFEEIGQEEYYLNGDLNSWCIEALYHQSVKSYYRIDDGETQRMFLEIKNKSELIKVLKMLGIK